MDKIRQYHNEKELNQIKQVLKEKKLLDEILEEVDKLNDKNGK